MTQAHYVRTSNALFSKVGDEFVALNIERGQCYGLNDTASAIWDLLDTPQSLPSICAAIEARYEVDPQECRAQVQQVLDELIDEELVSKSEIGVDDD